MNVDVCSEALIIRTVDGEIVLLSCEFAECEYGYCSFTH